MKNVVDKARSTGNEQIMVCERGFSFGYNNLVSDMRSLVGHARDRAARWCSTPRTPCSCPAARARASGGQREFVPVLARAAVAAGVAGVFMETHPDPGEGALRRARTPGRSAAWERCSSTLKDIDAAVKARPFGEIALEIVKILKRRPSTDDLRKVCNERVSTTSAAARSSIREAIPPWKPNVVLRSGAVGRAAVPSGASTGTREAHELRDGDKKRYLGKGVTEGGRERERRVLKKPLLGHDAADQAGLDRKHDRARRHRRRRRRLGANALLAISLANAHAAAHEREAAALQAARRPAAKPRDAGADDEHHQRRRARRQQRSTSRSS